jgi:nucleoid-associated protein YgaU
VHRVAAGDTLWDIASRHTAPGGDVRRTVFDIQRASGIEGSLLVPGQVLRIPAG